MNPPTANPRRALVSVADKRELLPFCRGLVELGFEILSTGGTARFLAENRVAVTEVSAYTQFPEIMDGRVKTLHPKIHAGILARRGRDDAVLAEHEIAPIELVVVNLYPFEKTIAQPRCQFADAIENIDIGGPTLLRGAAKNHRYVSVVVAPERYSEVLESLRQHGEIPATLRGELATHAFAHTAAYDAAIAEYLCENLPLSAPSKSQDTDETAPIFPPTLNLRLRQVQSLRYGENPHQAAAFYAPHAEYSGIAAAIQVQGKALSLNNIADSDAALRCVAQFDEPHACVIVKHANPCGCALRESQADAYARAFNSDRESAFGGIIAFNQSLQGETAAAIVANQFAEVVIAPQISAEARAALAPKPNIRVLECAYAAADLGNDWDYRSVCGGVLVQQTDRVLHQKLEVVSKRAPSDAEMADLAFAWKIAKLVKSNAIVYARDRATVGVGAGQMSRVNSARIAIIKAQHAGLEIPGAVMASDAFFPFRDGVDQAAEVGIRALIQPGGSLRDPEVIAAADEHDMAMLFTATRHFRH